MGGGGGGYFAAANSILFLHVCARNRKFLLKPGFFHRHIYKYKCFVVYTRRKKQELSGKSPNLAKWISCCQSWAQSATIRQFNHVFIDRHCRSSYFDLYRIDAGNSSLLGFVAGSTNRIIGNEFKSIVEWAILNILVLLTLLIHFSMLKSTVCRSMTLKFSAVYHRIK